MASYDDSVGPVTYSASSRPSARWNAATLAGNKANVVALPFLSTLKIVPDRSPTKSVPSAANASPHATPRSVANDSTDPSRSTRYTVPSKRLATYRGPSRPIAGEDRVVHLVQPGREGCGKIDERRLPRAGSEAHRRASAVGNPRGHDGGDPR